MMKVKYGKYMIYRMYNRGTKENLTVFFPPDTDLFTLMLRKQRLNELKSNNFIVCGILYVNEETYLNAKINETVNDYLYTDRQEATYREKYFRGDISFDCFAETMSLVSEHKWTVLRVLNSQMRRAWRRDYAVENEMAHILYNYHIK